MITAKIYSHIKDFGYLEYNARDLYDYIKEHDPVSFEGLDMEVQEFEAKFNDSTSIIFNTYQYFPTIKKCGALEYKPERIAKILMVDVAEFKKLMENTESREFKKWEQGMLESQFRSDDALNQDAESGNKESIKLLEKRRKERVSDELKRELFGIDAGNH